MSKNESKDVDTNNDKNKINVVKEKNMEKKDEIKTRRSIEKKLEKNRKIKNRNKISLRKHEYFIMIMRTGTRKLMFKDLLAVWATTLSHRIDLS